MKRSKRIVVLLIILAVVCIATFALTKYEEKQEEIQTSNAVILEISADEVQTFSWDEISFYKEGDIWIYEEDEAFPVSEEKIKSILSHFESFGASFMIENVEDYSQYGLDKPECVISLTSSEQSYELKLGNFSKMDEQRYVDIGDGNVYLVSEDPMNYLETEISAMILHDEIPAWEQVSEITFAGSENNTVQYIEDSEDSYLEDDVYFIQKDGKNLPLDTDTVNEYLDTIASLQLQDYVSYNISEEELESFGLQEPELSVTIAYSYTDEDENELSDNFVLHIGQNVEELEKAKKAEEDGEDEIPEVTKYVRIGDSKIVYKLTNSSYDILAEASYDDLRHKEVFWADFDNVTKMDIALEGEHYVFTSEKEKDDEERIWYYNEEEIEIYSVESKLKALEADSFTDEASKEKEEISFTIYLDNENFPETKIQLYRYDGSSCLAVVDGESVSLVERKAVVDFIEAVQEIVLN